MLFLLSSCCFNNNSKTLFDTNGFETNSGIVRPYDPDEISDNLLRDIFNNGGELKGKPVKELDLSGCKSITRIPDSLPVSIKKLILVSCENIISLHDLPAALEFLFLDGCSKLVNLPMSLPVSLEEMSLWGCSRIIALPELPVSLKRLKLGRCNNLRELPTTLPRSLEELDLRFCENITHLPELPELLKKLNLGFCKNLVKLPEILPRFIEELYLWDCKKLTKLPLKIELEKLKILDVRGTVFADNVDVGVIKAAAFNGNVKSVKELLRFIKAN
jgi:hypothetical protein